MSGTEKSSYSTADLTIKPGRIPLKKIVQPEGLFDGRVPLRLEPAALIQPVLVYKEKNTFVIIDGSKRCRTLRRRGRDAIPCAIIQKTLTPVSAGLLRISLNAGRWLHPREKLMFVGWLRSHLQEREYRKFVEKLGLPAAERHDYEELGACRPWLVDAVMRGTLDSAVAPEMNHLSKADAGVLVGLFSSLSFSRQMQRELAEWLPEIAFIGKTTLQELLGSARFAGPLADKRLNDPQKVARIHDEAHSSRFPLYSETKKAWTESTRLINPDPSTVSFQASPYFEKNSLEIKIKATRAEHLQHIMRRLASIELYDWQELINPSAGISPKAPSIPPMPEDDPGNRGSLPI